FGDTLGQAIGANDKQINADIENANKTYMETGNKWAEMAKNSTDQAKREKYLKMANESYKQAGSTYQAVLPAIEKTNKQILGEAAGVALDVVTAGTVGKAAAGAKSFKLTKAAPTIIKEAVKPASLIKGAVKGAAGGAVIGGAYGAAGAAQENGDIIQGAKSGAKGGAILGGVVGGITAKTSKTVSKDTHAELSKNLNKIFDNSTATVRNTNKFAAEQGTNIAEELAKRKIMPKVENERMVFAPEHAELIEKEIKDKSKIIDEATKLYKTSIPVEDLVKKAISKIKGNYQIANEGRVDEVTQKAIDKLQDFANQKGRSYFTLNEIQNFKKGMWSASKKFKATEIGNADAYSELGNVFKQVIEDEIPDASIQAINREIGSLENVSKLLTKVDKAGGVVLKGGRLGKYASGLTGSIVGAGAGGLVGGPAGGAVGAAVGSAASGSIRKLSQKKSILGSVDRVLFKLSKKKPASATVKDALKFLEDAKNGKMVTPTPRVQKAANEMLKQYGFGVKELLALPVGKTKGTVNNVAIKMGTSEGSIEKGAKVSKTMITGTSPAAEAMKAIKNMPSAEYQLAVKKILAKKESGKPLTRIEKAIEEMRRGKR
ncbi:MAG: hypothetical protein WCY09_09925, partial [Candidatus Omnitrophota bacterium]